MERTSKNTAMPPLSYLRKQREKPKRQHLQQKISGAVTFWMLKYTVSPALTNSTHPEKPKWTGATRRTE
jgi:hypothetical protein